MRNVKSRILLTLLMSLLFSLPLKAAGERFGAGLYLGSPLGLSVAHYLNINKTIDGLLSFSSGSESFHVHANYLINNYEVFKLEKHFYHTYYGVGIKYVAGDKGKENELGIRVPGAIFARMDKAPVEFILEVAPVLNIVESTRLEAEFGLIARYMF